MTDWNAISAFMASVVPWPTSQGDVGYVNLHYSFIPRNAGQTTADQKVELNKGGGWAFRSVDTFVQRAAWGPSSGFMKDQWFCLSLQKECKFTAKSKSAKAVRKAANALAVKAIWADVDVGTKPGEYATINDALKACLDFKERHGLPDFSAVVFSGGGIQIYWISTSAMTVKEWLPFAEGLKALMLQDKLVKDAGVTTDVARILRVPGSFNHKYDPPAPVQLSPLPLKLYDFETDLAMLKAAAPLIPQTRIETPDSIFADDSAAALFKGPKPAWMTALPTDDILHKQEDRLLDPRPIITQCGFYRDAFNTGGANLGQPLWMLSVLGTTFMENGNAFAHEISKGHAGYSEDATQALYDRKVAERADRGVGYPSCKAIADNGCQSCASCPLFSLGKSPLNIRPVAPVTATVSYTTPTLQAQTQGAKDLNLPAGYDLNAAGIICKVIEKEVNGELLDPEFVPLFYSVITNAWAQAIPDSLCFIASVDLGNTTAATILHEDISPIKLQAAYNRERVKIVPESKQYLEGFTMAWLARLHAIAAAQKAMPYGWHRENGAINGFVYGGTFYKEDGTEERCGVADPNIKRVFYNTGDVQHWRDAAKLITDQQRPELNIILAMAFAGPLLYLTGHKGAAVSVYGDSGVGKSAAYAVAVGMWGHATKGKQTTKSTFNGIMNMMANLNNIPVFWDEIKDKSLPTVYDVIFDITMGVEKARMLDGQRSQDRGMWSTQFMVAANISFVDYVLGKDNGNTAGVSRVLEYRVVKDPNPRGRIDQTEAQKAFAKLDVSFGVMGALYSKFLAMNHVQVEQDLTDLCKQVAADLQTKEEERFWVAQVGTMLLGVKLAIQLGVEFDYQMMKDFFYQMFRDNAARRDTFSHNAGTAQSTEELMAAYFDEVSTKDQILWTDGMPDGVGKPKPVPVLHGPQQTKNVSVTTSVAVRFDVKGRDVYILKDHLKKWLIANGGNLGTVYGALQKHYGAVTRERVSIGAGIFDTGRRSVVVIPNVGPNHDWANMMYKWTQKRPEGDEPVEELQPIDTGIVPNEDVVKFVQGAVRG